MKLERITRVLFAVLLVISLVCPHAADALELLAEAEIAPEPGGVRAMARGAKHLWTTDLTDRLTQLGLKFRVVSLSFPGIFEKSRRIWGAGVL